jgi:hypothetical protein
MVGQKGVDGKSISRDHKGGNPRGFGLTEWMLMRSEEASMRRAEFVSWSDHIMLLTCSK